MNAGCRLGTATPGISSKKSSSASPSSIKLLPLARRRRVSSRFLVASTLAGRGAEGRGGRTVGRRGGGTATAARRAATAARAPLLPPPSLFSSPSSSAAALPPPPPLAATLPPPPLEISDLSSPGLVRSGRGRAKGFTAAAVAALAATALSSLRRAAEAASRSAESRGETSPASTSPFRIDRLEVLRSRSWLWFWLRFSSPEAQGKEEQVGTAALAGVASESVSAFLGGKKALEGGADVCLASPIAATAAASGGRGGSSSRASKAPGRRDGGSGRLFF